MGLASVAEKWFASKTYKLWILLIVIQAKYYSLKKIVIPNLAQKVSSAALSKKILLFIFNILDAIIPTDVSHPVDESEPTQEKEWDTEETTVVGEKESEETKSIFEVTTEPSKTTTSTEDDDEEYEIVPDTNCDDGEWVESEALKQVSTVCFP